jgi:hypothetical protein
MQECSYLVKLPNGYRNAQCSLPPNDQKVYQIKGRERDRKTNKRLTEGFRGGGAETSKKIEPKKKKGLICPSDVLFLSFKRFFLFFPPQKPTPKADR